MDYGKLLSRAWNLIWEHKFLILLGIIVALGSSGGSGGLSSGGRSLSQADQDWRSIPPLSGWEFDVPTIPMLMAIILVGLVLVIALAVWVVSTLSRGALIAGASAVDAGRMLNFGEAFGIAWRRGWTLLGIGLLPAIPALLLLLVSLGALGIYVGAQGIVNGLDQVAGLRNAWVVLGSLTCIALPLVFVLNLLRTFANRACMLEDCGVFAAYRRGFEVLIANIGSALLLFLIQIGIAIASGLLLLLPALCCVLWPLLVLAQGVGAAYFSTLWTLAWNQWTGVALPAEETLTV